MVGEYIIGGGYDDNVSKEIIMERPTRQAKIAAQSRITAIRDLCLVRKKRITAIADIYADLDSCLVNIPGSSKKPKKNVNHEETDEDQNIRTANEDDGKINLRIALGDETLGFDEIM